MSKKVTIKNLSIFIFTIGLVALHTSALTSNTNQATAVSIEQKRKAAFNALKYDFDSNTAKTVLQEYMNRTNVDQNTAKQHVFDRNPAINNCELGDGATQISKFSLQYKRLCVIDKLHENELDRIISTKPIVHLEKSNLNTETVATYTLQTPDQSLRLSLLSKSHAWKSTNDSNLNMSQFKIGATAEWHQGQLALLHTPSDELFFGLIHPDAALFESTFSLSEARTEHQDYMQLLNKNGVRTTTVRTLLLQGADIKGSQEYQSLLDLARSRLEYQFTLVTAEALKRESSRCIGNLINIDAIQRKYRDCVLSQLPPEQLVDIIFTKPVVRFRLVQSGAIIELHHFEQPETNLYFLRDQMITTKNGVVISRMNSKQRAGEPEIIKLALSRLKITPAGEITNKGRLEGGDYIPAGSMAFLGLGLRTNQEALDQLLQKSLLDHQVVVAVKDQNLTQDQMHLDTHFNIAGKEIAVMLQNRYEATDPGDRWFLKADVYQKQKRGFRKVHSDINFRQLLENSGYHIIPVSQANQIAYGINFLTMGDKNIAMVAGTSTDYIDRLTDLDINVNLVDFTNMKRGWGAAHCTLQVLSRQE